MLVVLFMIVSVGALLVSSIKLPNFSKGQTLTENNPTSIFDLPKMLFQNKSTPDLPGLASPTPAALPTSTPAPTSSTLNNTPNPDSTVTTPLITNPLPTFTPYPAATNPASTYLGSSPVNSTSETPLNSYLSIGMVNVTTTPSSNVSITIKPLDISAAPINGIGSIVYQSAVAGRYLLHFYNQAGQNFSLPGDTIIIVAPHKTTDIKVNLSSGYFTTEFLWAP